MLKVENKNYRIYSKRKTSFCIIKEGTLGGIYFRNLEYLRFSSYQRNIFDKMVVISYTEILKEYPSLYSQVRGGGITSSFQAFCSSINKILRINHPEIKITTDSRIKLMKKPGGRGARAKRQKSYR